MARGEFASEYDHNTLDSYDPDYSGSGSYIFVGSVVSAGAGDDSVYFGSSFDSTFYGGYGVDTIVFSGSRASWRLTFDYKDDGSVKSVSTAGYNTIIGFEVFKFSDATFRLPAEKEPSPKPDQPPAGPGGTTIALSESGWRSSAGGGGLWSFRPNQVSLLSDTHAGVFSLTVPERVRAACLDGADQLLVRKSRGNGLQVDGVLDLGPGADQITIDLKDSLTGQSSGRNPSAASNAPVGLLNYGLLDGGSQDDLIRVSTNSGTAVLNNGVIELGDGNDTLDVGRTGLRGNGTVSLGAGNDLFRGFGSHALNGGAGADAVRFNPGRYRITELSATVFRVVRAADSLILTAFESVASSDVLSAVDLSPSNILPLREGTLQVSSSSTRYL